MDWACSACTGQLSGSLASVTASSALSGNYAAVNAIDGRADTAWCEGVTGPGVGSWIELTLKAPVHLDAMRIHGGYFKSAAVLAANGRISRFTLTVDGARTASFTLADPTVLGRDDITGQPVTDPQAWFDRALRSPPILGTPQAWAGSKALKAAKMVRITIDGVYPGSKYTDTCVSELSLIFARPEDLE